MSQQLVLLQLFSLLLAWLLLARVPVATPSIAIPSCPEKCGDVFIPYPFGFGSKNCYKDERFKVTCKNNSTKKPKPFLASLGVEVLEITLQQVRVKYQVFGSCNDTEVMGGKFYSLEGSPFFFSYINNTFMATGCDNFASFTGSKGLTRGCVSICSSNNKNTDRGCYGTNCCQTPLPLSYSLRTLNVTIKSLGQNNGKGGCKYAFLADERWQLNYVKNSIQIKDTDHVPVVLDWMVKYNQSNASESNFWCDYNAYHWYSYKGYYTCECSYGYKGNPYIYGGCQGVGLSVGLLFLLLTSFWLYKLLKKRRIRKIKEKFFKRNGGMLLEQQISSEEGSVEKTKIFNAEELEKATDNYNENRILGQGGQGTVYKGMLHCGRIVAIKKAKLVDEGQVEQFINEVVILSQINHRNVVKLLGCCLETEVPLLVYEFISNGTLFHHIHSQTEDFLMSWDNRLRIITEVAGALAYLHSSVSMPIYHRDVKSTNILLDDKYRAKVSDFGTSRSVPVDKTHLTTLVQGTMGYLDPEYFQTSQFTDKSDVYSFGVVLVELLTGEKPISLIGSQEKRNLVTYFIQSTKENRLFEILDAQIVEGQKEELEVVAGLAKRCVTLNGKKRPTMKEVAIDLEGLRMSPTYVLSEKNHNEEEVIIETSSLWDIGSTSTSYANLENSGAMPLDDQPLLFNTR